jgi:hypothetical protein
MAGLWNTPIGGRTGTIDPVARGANWFFWIAGLSVANTVLYLLGQSVFMVMGLASAAIASGFFQGIGNGLGGGRGSVLGVVSGLLGALLISSIFVGLGWAARKRMAWAFIVGMVLYALDALIWLAFRDYMSVLFHGLALVLIFQGFQALVRRKAAPSAVAVSPVGDPVLAQAQPVAMPATPAMAAGAPTVGAPRESTAPAAFDMQPPSM